METAHRGIVADLDVLLTAELHAITVIEVGHGAPRRLARGVLHVFGRGYRGGALLELDCLSPGICRDVDELLRDLDVTVVVEPDFGDDVDRVTRSYGYSANDNGHDSSLCVRLGRF